RIAYGILLWAVLRNTLRATRRNRRLYETLHLTLPPLATRRLTLESRPISGRSGRATAFTKGRRELYFCASDVIGLFRRVGGSQHSIVNSDVRNRLPGPGRAAAP